MLVLCYHNGALGHTVSALIDSCTKEVGGNFPSFVINKNLHHYIPQSRVYQVKHPYIDIEQERKHNNIVISSSSKSVFGRLLILLMGLLKSNVQTTPGFNAPVVYKQNGTLFGEQLEILSLTLKDKISKEADWYTDVDYQLDVMDFWTNPQGIEKFLLDCNLTPIPVRVLEFCQKVREINAVYFDTVKKCVTITQDVINNKEYNIDLTFYEAAMCHMLLLQHFNKTHNEVKLVQCMPTNTASFIQIFKD
jgi:hypothetical protein